MKFTRKVRRNQLRNKEVSGKKLGNDGMGKVWRLLARDAQFKRINEARKAKGKRAFMFDKKRKLYL